MTTGTIKRFPSCLHLRNRNTRPEAKIDRLVGYFLNGIDFVGVTSHPGDVGIAGLVEKFDDSTVAHEGVTIAMFG